MSKTVLSSSQVSDLKRAGLNQGQIDIVVHNLTELVNARKITTNTVGIIIHNIINDQKFRANFFKDPRKAIMEANPQPSP